MAKKPQIVVEVNTYADGLMIDKEIKVIEPGPDWISRIILGVVVPLGFWLMAMGDML